MDTDIRRLQVEFHQQQLRNDAAAERLADGARNGLGSQVPTSRIPRTIGALRRLIGTAGA